MRLYEAPQVFPQSMSRDDRLSVLSKVAEHSEQRFQEEYFQLNDWFAKYDALYLLAFCSFYFLSQPEGVDPEVKGSLDFYPFHLEILQAFSLTQERHFSNEPLGEEAEQLLQVMGEIGNAIQLRAMRDLVELADCDIRQHSLLQSIRTQTTAVRNWAYLPHMRYVTRGLAETVRQDFIDLHNIDPLKLADALYGLANKAEERLNHHIGWVRSFFHQGNYASVVAAYIEPYPNQDDFDPDTIFDMVGGDLKSFKALLLQLSDSRLHDIFIFSLKDIADVYGSDVETSALSRVFDKVSIEFGGLHDHNKEHFILDNPVWKKPFIKIDSDAYFSSTIGLMPHYTMGLLESLISEDSNLEERYRSRKGRYLEDQLEKLFKDSFPAGKIFRGSLWEDGEDSNGENDLTAVVGGCAIVVEAKSGQISPPASRGAPDRLRRTIQDLIEEPAEQANRFIRVLKSLKEPHAFPTRQGSVNTIDPNGIRYYVPITVTLDQFGSVGNLRSLIESGISSKTLPELASVISLTDLMVIFDILDLQSEKIHYLARRKEIDAHVVWNGDELDILAFYLGQGFNIGEAEFSGDHGLGLWLASKQLDPYYLGRDSGVSVPKPSLALTQRWRDMLQRLDLAKVDYWLEAALILLNVEIRDQQKFERFFERLCSRVRRDKLRVPHESLCLVSGPPQRRFFLAFYPYIGIDRETRNSVIGNLLDSPAAEEARGAICIGVDLEEPYQAYSVAALRQLPKLFDDL